MSPTFFFVCLTSVSSTTDLDRFLKKETFACLSPYHLFRHVVANKSRVLCDGGFGGYRVLLSNDKTLDMPFTPLIAT